MCFVFVVFKCEGHYIQNCNKCKGRKHKASLTMAESVADEEEDDIYTNLPDFKYDDTLKKLENANKELKDHIQHLETQYHETAEENLKLKEENHHLHENISSLLKTAHNELKRKDRVIEELRRENNQLLFRRKKIPHKTESESRERSDVSCVHKKHESVDNCSNFQRHEERLQVISTTSNMVTDVRSILKASNNLPDTQTCTTKSRAQSTDEVNVSRLQANLSTSVEVLPEESLQDNYSSSKVHKNVVETVFSARLRKRLNAPTETNKKEVFVCTNTKQSCVLGRIGDKINTNKEERLQNDGTIRLKTTEIVAEASQKEEKSVNACDTLVELDSDSSGLVEFCSVDANQDPQCTTNVQENVVETFFSERKRKRLNTATEKDDKEILVCSGTKQSSDSRNNEAKIYSSKEEGHTHDEAATHNDLLELEATKIVKEASENQEKSVTAGNKILELESYSSGSIEVDSGATNHEPHCTTQIQKNVTETAFSEQEKNRLNTSKEKDGKEILFCSGTKQLSYSRSDDTKLHSSKEQRHTHEEAARHDDLQGLKSMEIVEEDSENQEKSVTAGNKLEVESNVSGSVELLSVDANQEPHCTTEVQKNVAETAFSGQRRKRLNTSKEKDVKKILACSGTKQSSEPRSDETKIYSSKEQTHKEAAIHNTLQELNATEIEKGVNQTETKSGNTSNIIDEQELNFSESTKVHSVYAKQNHYCTTKVQKNGAETSFGTQTRKQLNASIEQVAKEILVCPGAKHSSNTGKYDVKVNSSAKERNEKNDTSEHNTYKALKEVPLNERTFVNADNVPGELQSNSHEFVEYQSVAAKQVHHCTSKVQNNGVETLLIAQRRKQLKVSKETDDQEILAYANTKTSVDCRSGDDTVIVSEGKGDINDAVAECKTAQKSEITSNVKNVSPNERKFADAENILGERLFINPDHDSSKQCSYGTDSRKHHPLVSDIRPHSTAIQNCRRSSSQSSSTKSSSIESCVIQSEERHNDQRSSERESTKRTKPDVKTNYPIAGKHTECIRSIKASASVRVANSVKSKYSRSRSKTPFDGSRFKIPKLSSKHRVRIERTSVLEQNDTDSDSARTKSSRQYSLHNSHRPYISSRSRSRLRQSYRDNQHYTERHKYKRHDSSPVRECLSYSKHERRHSSTKFRDKDKRHIAIKPSSVSKRPDPTKMETGGLLKKNIYSVDAEKVKHSQKKPRNVDFSLENYRRELITGKSDSPCSFLGDEKCSKPSQKIQEPRNVMGENYNERKTQRTKSCSLKEATETDNLNISKGNEYKLNKITFDNKEHRKPVSDLYRRLLSNSNSKVDKIQNTPELFHTTTNKLNPIGCSGSAILASEQQRKEDIVSSSAAQNVTGLAVNDTEGKLKNFSNSAVFKTDGVSVSIFREKCDFSTSRKRKSVVIRSQRSSVTCGLDSPEEKRQRLNTDNKTVVETTNTSAITIHNDNITKSGQSAVEKTASVESGINIPVGRFIDGSRTEGARDINCVTDKQYSSVNSLGKLNHELHLEGIENLKEKVNNSSLHSEYVSEMKNRVSVSIDSTDVSVQSLHVESHMSDKGSCIPQEFSQGKVAANKEVFDCTTEEELEEGEILDDSPVKTSTAVVRFSESVRNVTSKQVSQHINSTSGSKPLLQFSDKSSHSKRHSTSSPSLRDHIFHKEQQHDPNKRQKITDTEMVNKYKVLDEFQNSVSEDLGVSRKQSAQYIKPSEVKDSIIMNEKALHFEKESSDVNNITSDNKSSIENEEPKGHLQSYTMSSSMVSENVCLISNDVQVTESDIQWNKHSDGNEMKCKGEEQVSSDSRSLNDAFSVSDKDVTVSEDVNFSLNIETVTRADESYKQIDEKRSDETKSAESCIVAKSDGDAVAKDVDVSEIHMAECDHSSVTGVHKESRPNPSQKAPSKLSKKDCKEYSEQESKDVSIKNAVAPSSPKLVSPPRRKKNARMTISTSQSSLQSEILMANLLQAHSPYKVGIHDESLPVSNKYSEEIVSDASYDKGTLTCNTSKGSVSLESCDKHNTNSQRITKSKTSRFLPFSCQPDENNCSSKKSLNSHKKNNKKLIDCKNEQINIEEELCKMTPQHYQSEVENTDSTCYISVDDLNVGTHLGDETDCEHISRELKSGNYQAVTENNRDGDRLQEISDEATDESRQTLEKECIKMAGDGYTEARGGKEVLSGEELLKILEGSYENESGESENVVRESDSLQPENSVMSCPQQSEISATKDLPSATNKKNIIIRRRSRKCVLEEAENAVMPSPQHSEISATKDLQSATNKENIIIRRRSKKCVLEEVENAVMLSPQQCEISATKDLPSATVTKNIIIRRRSRKCVLEEAPIKCITINPLDDTMPDNLIDSSVAVPADELCTNNNSPVCVTPSVPLCLQNDDSSCSSSCSSASSSSGSNSVTSCSSSCTNSSSSTSLRSRMSGSSKSSTGEQQEESDKMDCAKVFKKSLRATPARRLYQKKSQMVVHQPKNDTQDPNELEMSLNSSSSGNTSDDTFDPKKNHMNQLDGTWIRKKRPRNKR